MPFSGLVSSADKPNQFAHREDCGRLSDLSKFGPNSHQSNVQEAKLRNNAPDSRTDIEKSTTENKNDRWLFASLLFVVALSPLPFGSNRPLPMAILGCSLGALMTVWAAMASWGAITPRSDITRIRASLLLYGVVCLWIVVQWTVWIPQQFADPIWKDVATLGNTNLLGRITVNPGATLTGLAHLIVYISVFWLTFQLTHRQDRAWTVVRLIASVGCLYSLYGIIIFASGNKWILIYPKWTYLESLTSTFVNRNSFATFAGLCLLCALTSLLNHLTPFTALKHPTRTKIALVIEEIATRGAWKTLSVLAIALALMLSASRGGVTATFFSLIFLLSTYVFQRRWRRHQIIYFATAATLVAFAIFATSGNLISQRLAQNEVDANFDMRSSVYTITYEAIKSSPWTGTGFGTFADVFPAYRYTSESSPISWDKAHNTYLENALELGIPATLLLNLSVLLLALQSARGIATRKRNKMIPALGVAATILVGLHSLVDFSLQIPAISILYACIMGVSVGQSWRQSK